MKFSKTFELVNSKIVMPKVHSLGIGGSVSILIPDFLTTRSLYVRVEDESLE